MNKITDSPIILILTISVAVVLGNTIWRLMKSLWFTRPWKKHTVMKHPIDNFIVKDGHLQVQPGSEFHDMLNAILGPVHTLDMKGILRSIKQTREFYDWTQSQGYRLERYGLLDHLNQNLDDPIWIRPEGKGEWSKPISTNELTKIYLKEKDGENKIQGSQVI